jgi:MFS transporter, AAHS family, 4-hydroxybenzoate transporter
MSTLPTLDVQAFLNEQRLSKFQWLIFALCFCILLLDGFDTAAIGYIAPSLIKEWGVARPALAPVLSAALLGLAAGALSAGPLADRFGRKRVLVVSVLLFGVASLLSAQSPNLEYLVALRFLTGIGLGAAMPNAVTMVSEYSPGKRRAMITNAMSCGFALGAALGGFLAAWMIPQWGWRSVLELGGTAPLILTVLMVFLLPESVRYLVAKGRSNERVRAVLSRISGSTLQPAVFVSGEHTNGAKAQSGVAIVLSRRYVLGSVMMWLAQFSGLVIFYALINWMPILFKDAGLGARDATLISALFPLGAVGAIFSGWLMDRYNANKVIAIGYGLTAISVAAIGQAVGSVGLLVVVVFIAGILMNTAQSSMPALAAAYYPTAGRATGVAWMLGIARFGGIAGSYLVAEMSRQHLELTSIFAVIAIPGLVACAAVLIKNAARPQAAAAHGEPFGNSHVH